ncbi:ABC transporter permease [Caminibacter mediatlanticus TB-2]|uniref:ABC transporter permease n=1 Tax=Caminibacter mediatlanticus TB-2 TaxID=391592 RepID=A0ABX5V661_9BACT|nr:ABC transporter permease [Caminibacter mediatlanticus]QCT93760.1 ABC transporter permease [Caminibacter mediatlanticus TB-2]
MNFSKKFNFLMYLYVILFFFFLLTPLVVISILAFNDASYIGFPFKGFTLDWFFGDEKRVGVFNNEELLNSIYISFKTGIIVSLVSLFIGLFSSLYFEKSNSKIKNFFYYFGISPLIIPGVILGIAILTYTSEIVMFLNNKEIFAFDDYLSPGFWLLVIGQISFISSYSMLIIMAQLKKFDPTLEEAALSLKATKFEVLRYIIIPFLKPSLIKAFFAGFLLSFSNFNTTVFLVGSDPTLPIYLFSQVKYSLTPVVNAVSFLVIISITLLGLINFFIQRSKK